MYFNQLTRVAPYPPLGDSPLIALSPLPTPPSLPKVNDNSLESRNTCEQRRPSPRLNSLKVLEQKLYGTESIRNLDLPNLDDMVPQPLLHPVVGVDNSDINSVLKNSCLSKCNRITATGEIVVDPVEVSDLDTEEEDEDGTEGHQIYSGETCSSAGSSECSLQLVWKEGSRRSPLISESNAIESTDNARVIASNVVEISDQSFQSNSPNVINNALNLNLNIKTNLMPNSIKYATTRIGRKAPAKPPRRHSAPKLTAPPNLIAPRSSHSKDEAYFLSNSHANILSTDQPQLKIIQENYRALQSDEDILQAFPNDNGLSSAASDECSSLSVNASSEKNNSRVPLTSTSIQHLRSNPHLPLSSTSPSTQPTTSNAPLSVRPAEKVYKPPRKSVTIAYDGTNFLPVDRLTKKLSPADVAEFGCFGVLIGNEVEEEVDFRADSEPYEKLGRTSSQCDGKSNRSTDTRAKEEFSIPQQEPSHLKKKYTNSVLSALANLTGFNANGKLKTSQKNEKPQSPSDVQKQGSSLMLNGTNQSTDASSFLDISEASKSNSGNNSIPIEIPSSSCSTPNYSSLQEKTAPASSPSLSKSMRKRKKKGRKSSQNCPDSSNTSDEAATSLRYVTPINTSNPLSNYIPNNLSNSQSFTQFNSLNAPINYLPATSNSVPFPNVNSPIIDLPHLASLDVPTNNQPLSNFSAFAGLPSENNHISNNSPNIQHRDNTSQSFLPASFPHPAKLGHVPYYPGSYNGAPPVSNFHVLPYSLPMSLSAPSNGSFQLNTSGLLNTPSGNYTSLPVGCTNIISDISHGKSSLPVLTKPSFKKMVNNNNSKTSDHSSVYRGSIPAPSRSSCGDTVLCKDNKQYASNISNSNCTRIPVRTSNYSSNSYRRAVGNESEHHAVANSPSAGTPYINTLETSNAARDEHPPSASSCTGDTPLYGAVTRV